MSKKIILQRIRRLAVHVEKPTELKKTASIEINKRMKKKNDKDKEIESKDKAIKKFKPKTKHPF
jgi:hypothetical protein